MIALSKLVSVIADVTAFSPNSNARPAWANAIECTVLHATADEGNELGAEAWMRNPESQASAHLHIRRDGTIVRLVDDHLRAWHAGRSSWLGKIDVNDFSLGWEIANRNDGVENFTSAQYEALASLGAHYIRQGLPSTCFLSHAEVGRPLGRKSDPRGFDWGRFRTDAMRIVRREHSLCSR